MKKEYLLILLATSMSFATRIGVLKKDANFKCKEQVTIDLDVEDSHNATTVVSGTKSLPGISLGGHAVFTYCVLNVNSMPASPFDYAVLRLDKKCPEGTKQFSRHHDTEDSRNRNSHSGNISPNIVNKNATLEYCFVPADEKTKNKYPSFDKNYGDKYGVFANPDFNKNPVKKWKDNIAHSEILIDDEDSHSDEKASVCLDRGKKKNGVPVIECFHLGDANNANYWNLLLVMDDDIENRIKKIMNGTNNTTYHVVQWKSSASAMLGKSAVVDASNESFAENTLVAAAPLAPAIRGLDRNVVAVELKSAGDAKISVVNVKGAVIANIAEKNLQPGVHQVKWNSGMVPSGRYVVKIEQNGMVDAKNVILK